MFTMEKVINIIITVGSENMKIRIEVDNKITENDVIIRCNELSEDVKNIQINH